MAEISPITVARFWSKVSVTSKDSDCWEWNASKEAPLHHPSPYRLHRLFRCADICRGEVAAGLNLQAASYDKGDESRHEATNEYPGKP